MNIEYTKSGRIGSNTLSVGLVCLICSVLLVFLHSRFYYYVSIENVNKYSEYLQIFDYILYLVGLNLIFGLFCFISKCRSSFWSLFFGVIQGALVLYAGWKYWSYILLVNQGMDVSLTEVFDAFEVFAFDAFVVLLSFFIGYSVNGKQVFCEACNEWAEELKFEMRYDWFAFRKFEKTNNFDVDRLVKSRPVLNGDLKVQIDTCTKCNNLHAITIVDVSHLYKEFDESGAIILTNEQFKSLKENEEYYLQLKLGKLKSDVRSVVDPTPVVVEESPTITEVKIGHQTWMTRNLDVDHFRNGDPISEARTEQEWMNAGIQQQPAWCYFDNLELKGKIYGKLYNWYAVIDPRGLAPEGWHIPSDAEWTQLIENVGGEDLAGLALKGRLGWGENGGGKNSYGFTGEPGGWRTCEFSNDGTDGLWWSSSEDNDSSTLNFNLFDLFNGCARCSNDKQDGLSVRCLRD